MTDPARDLAQLRLSSGEIAPYAIDGVFLSSLRQDMIDLGRGFAIGDTLSCSVEVSDRNGERRASLVRRGLGEIDVLTNGSIPSPACVEITVSGSTFSSGAFAFYVVMQPGQSDFISASGPALITRAGFDLMQRRLAERALPVENTKRSIFSSNIDYPTIVGMSAVVQAIVFMAASQYGWTTYTSAMLGLSIVFLTVSLSIRRTGTATPAPVSTIDLSRPTAQTSEKLERALEDPLS